VEKRSVSTIAPQALFMMNHEFVREQATQFAARLLREANHDEASRIDWACRILFARPVRPEELAISHRLLADLGGATSEAAWRELAHVLLCSNEFIYVD
jgi:hypothetical protein